MNIDNRFLPKSMIFLAKSTDRKIFGTKNVDFLGLGANSDLNFSDKKNKNQGFSLIEIIVVVAIMAVMILVLAPKLLSYGERSRAQKDSSTMDEVTNAIQLALSDQQIYDEVVQYSMVDNVSCYVDSDSEANYQRIVTKENPDGVDQYTFLSDARTLDETPYFAAGNMRGVTITFAPNKGSNGSTFDLQQGIINQYGQARKNKRVGELPELYNRLRSVVGDTVICDSPTYRNSEFTVFIALGSTGGNDADAQDAIRTYGQWSGTNLPLEVSYKIVSDRSVGDTGNEIVDDALWNEANGNKITTEPGDLNGGGTYIPGTPEGYISLDNGDGTRTEFIDRDKDVVELEFFRWNDATNNYEKWREIDVLKGVKFSDASYDPNTVYRFENGLTEFREEALEKTVKEFKYWTNTPNGSTETLTEDTTITTSMKIYAKYLELVCENANTGEKFETLEEAIKDANEQEEPTKIIVIKDLDFGANKTLTVDGNLTISGPGEISRGDFTGTLFKIPSGSKLTLDNGVIIDGHNKWTLNEELYQERLKDRVVGTYLDYVTSENGGTVTTAPVFVVEGELVVRNMTVRNFYNTKDSNGGDGAIFKVNAGGKLTMDGTTITHATTRGANVVAHLAKDAKWYIKGDTMINDNFAGRNGGICRNDSGQIYMSDGTIKDNVGINVNGSVFMMYGVGSEFNMSGGMICGNSSVSGVNNGRCAAVYLHANSYMKMTGGTICHNIGGTRGGIDSSRSTAMLDINEGGDGIPTVIENISLDNSEWRDVGHSNNFDSWSFTTGIYTQDVSNFCSEGYKCIPYAETERTDDYIVVPE